MKKFFLLFLCFVSAHINISCSQEQNLITKVEQYFNNIKTLSAEFTQESNLEGKKISSGSIYVSKPGMIKFDYKNPKKLTIILRDNNIMYHDYELNETSYVTQNNYFFQLLSEANLKFKNEDTQIKIKSLK